MAKQLVTIDIDKEAGTFTVDTAGFHGAGCKGIHDAFAKMGTVVKEKAKPEFYEKPAGSRIVAGR